MGIIVNKAESDKNAKAFKMNTKSKQKSKIQLGWASGFVKIEDDAFSQMEIVTSKFKNAPKTTKLKSNLVV